MVFFSLSSYNKFICGTAKETDWKCIADRHMLYPVILLEFTQGEQNLMKIAICDDDRNELLHIQTLLDLYAQERQVDLIIKEYYSSFELASAAANETFQLYLLDVLMPVLNGMDLAREIRLTDKAADIIFLTSSPEFAVESYTVKASNYLLKPVQEDILFQALDDIFSKQFNEMGASIVVKTSIGVHKIHLASLVYVEALNRKVIYHLKNGEQMTSTEKFNSVCDSLMKQPEFMLPHRSYLVNMNYIRSITATDMHLQGGKIIPLAQRRVSEIKKHYLAFQMEEVGR